jgi:hypothetical protein
MSSDDVTTEPDFLEVSIPGLQTVILSNENDGNFETALEALKRATSAVQEEIKAKYDRNTSVLL